MSPLKIGTTLSERYKIDRVLAQSGSACLYQATETASAQRVWIKVLEHEALASALVHFQQETAGVTVLDVGKSEAGLSYIVASEPHADKREIPARAPRSLPPPALVDGAEVVLDDDDIIVDDDPTTAEFEPPTPALGSTFIRSPLFATVGTTPAPPEDPEPEDLERETPEIAGLRTTPAATWLAAIAVIASLTGVAGWYLGHGETRAAPVITPAATEDTPPRPPATAAAPLTMEPSTEAKPATANAATTAPPAESAAPMTKSSAAPQPAASDPLTL